MDFRDLTGYGKIIRNDADFPPDCISDAERKAFLYCWFDNIVKQATKKYPNSQMGFFGRIQYPAIWVNGRGCSDGTDGTHIKVSPRHNYATIMQGSCPRDIYNSAKEYAIANWRKPQKMEWRKMAAPVQAIY